MEQDLIEELPMPGFLPELLSRAHLLLKAVERPRLFLVA
jgi:hypothetical protein